MTSTSTRAGGQSPAPKFRLDIPAERRLHTDSDRYVVWVLWLIGHSQRSIAFVTGMRKKQVGGIIDKSEYCNRSAMTDQERRRLLLELKEIRMDDGHPLDGGWLNNIAWEIEPLTGAKRRPGRRVAS